MRAARLDRRLVEQRAAAPLRAARLDSRLVEQRAAARLQALAERHPCLG